MNISVVIYDIDSPYWWTSS